MPINPSQEDLDRLERLTKRRVIVNRDRSQQARAISVDVHGDRKTFRASTKTIEAGASETIYLTHTGDVGGEGVFTSFPHATLYQDADDTPGGLMRSNAPASPTTAMTLRSTTTASLDVIWVPSNKLWALRVTNADTAPHTYLVVCEGF